MLAIAAGAALTAVFLAGSESPSKSEAAAARAVAAPTARKPEQPKPGAAHPTPAHPTPARPADIRYDPFDPARLSGRERTPTPPPAPPPARSHLPALRGVYVDRTSRWAIFEGRTLAEGEALGEALDACRVESIRPDGVLLQCQDGPILVPVPAR